ncbi:transposable element Tc3 transposase [Trichonephila clavipes]|nr:transposable element Tc3 transposase [Trichonephila clavipes]
MVDFHKRILFSDEAHFWLNGCLSKQNCRIWSEANPQVYVETPLHPEKLTVWCALWAGGILLQNDEGHNVTVNGDRYRAMITNFFIPELNNHDVQELWFQQDGATWKRTFVFSAFFLAEIHKITKHRSECFILLTQVKKLQQNRLKYT